MEEWVTWALIRSVVAICDKCGKVIETQEVHMYVNGDNEIEEVLCEECWRREE